MSADRRELVLSYELRRTLANRLAQLTFPLRDPLLKRRFAGGAVFSSVGELGPFLGQPVLVPWRSLRVAALFDDALRHKPLEALGEHLARDPEVALDLVEALRAPADVPDDERRPGLSRDVEGAGDGAGHVAEVGSLHGRIIGQLPEGTE